MWARVASFEGTDVQRMKAEARRPPPDDIPEEFRGFLNLVDEGSGRQLFITLFESREAIEATEPWFERMGDQIPEELRGRRVSKEYWEVTGGIVQLA
jgi:hypothetical protein